jgi:hypothetical protein
VARRILSGASADDALVRCQLTGPPSRDSGWEVKINVETGTDELRDALEDKIGIDLSSDGCLLRRR